MMRQADLSSLNLVKAEVDGSLLQVQSHLESFVEEGRQEDLDAAYHGLTLVWGAMHLVGLQVADTLLEHARELVRRLPENGDDMARNADLTALGYAIMVLSRYIEYVQIKHVAWPQLLLPAVQQLCTRRQLPPPRDGELLPAMPLVVHTVSVPRLDAAVKAKALAQLCQVYRSGLIAWLGGADLGHLHWMRRALQRLQALLTTGEEQAVRRLLEGVIAAVQQGIAVNAPRKHFLMQIERWLTRLQQGSALLLSEDRRAIALYLIALAEPGEEFLQDLQKDYDLSRECLSERRMTEEFDLMCGPGHSVIRTVSSVLAEELAQLKDHLDMLSRGVFAAGEGGSLQDQIRRLAQTLKMLGLEEVSVRTQSWIDRVAHWGEPPPAAELLALVDMIVDVEDAMSRLLKEVTPGLNLEQGESAISPHQLDEARAMLVAESRSGLSLAKRAITSFMEASYDRMHLTNVPSTLNSVAGGMAFLGIRRAEAVLQQSAAYIEYRLLREETVPEMTAMELLADAISSIDYYLESLEAHKPIGEAVLQLAENSVAELGFPVPGRVAA